VNRIYRLVWNHALHVWQVASELAHLPQGCGVSGGARWLGRQRALALACAVALGTGVVPMAHAQATGTAGASGSNATTTTSATDGSAGGTALTLSGTDGAVNNDSTVTGGAGGAGGHVAGGLSGNGGTGGAGGAGVTGTGFTLTNSGQLSGGYGGQGGYAVQGTGGNGGNGGAGVSGTGFTLTNNTDALVLGGHGGAGGGSSTSNDTEGSGQVPGTGGQAGAGVTGTGFTLTNKGVIAGGWGFFGNPFSGPGAGSYDGTAGGDGVYVGSGSTPTTISNSGQIAGGDGGISGTGNDVQALDGGAGIRGTGFALTNGGYITGGPSGNLGSGNSGAGGLGVTGADFTVINAATGTIVGGMGGTGGAGVGGAGFTLTNAGSVTGGRGGFGDIVDGQAEDSGAGGAAVSGSGFTASNSGTITGGMGGRGQWIQPQYANPWGNIAQGGAGGDGGAGVTGTGFTLTNSGTIAGGYGRYGGSARWDGTTGSASSGAGISLDGGAGGTGGVGVGGTGFTMTNDGTITGGNGGAGGGAFYVGSDLSGVSFVLPGAGAGGAGVDGSAFTLVNNGTIQGGNGAYGGQGNQEQAIGAGQYQVVGVPAVGPGGSAGGAGVYVSSASASTSIANHAGATIIGGNGNGNYGWGTQGGAGGAGISGTGFTLANSGSVMGGYGGTAGSLFEAVPDNPSPNKAGAGGAGGAGIAGTHFTVTNQAGGAIAGGTGSHGGYGYITSDNSGAGAGAGAGGDGGAGISGADFTLTNAGQVTGGNGGAGGALGTHADTGNAAGHAGLMGAGGVGVVATGHAAILDAGDISGGLAGDGTTRADAVDLSGGGNTLTLEAGYSFTGNVVSTSGTTNGGDTLALGGSADATFNVSQIVTTAPTAYSGTPQFYGFTTYEKTGSSTWALTGTPPITIDWIVDQGTLDFSGMTGSVTASSLSGTGGSLDLGANTLTLDTSASSTFTGSVSGKALTLQGSGTQILDGQATFATSTTVAGGTLEIGDSDSPSATLTSPQVLVQSGGTLRGHGAVVGNVVNGGAVWPGGSVGVLTVHGDYAQNASGILTIDVTPTQASELKVDGHASLAGTLNLVYAPGTYAEHTYTLVQADALSGHFATTTATGTTPAALIPDVVYSPTAVYLALATVHPADGALYGNLQRAAHLADQQTLGTVLNTALGAADGMGDSAALSSGVARDAHQPGVWVQAIGNSLSLDGSPGLDSTGFGLLGGFDAVVTGSLHVGVEAGVNQLNAHDDLGGDGRIRSAHAGLYAFAYAGPLVVSATVDGQHQSDRIERVTGVGQAASSPAGHALSGGLQVAWPLQAGGWQFIPKLGALYQHQVLDAFAETIASDSPVASAYGVAGARSTYNALQPYALVTLAHAFQVWGVRYVPQIDVGYRDDVRGEVPTVMATAADGTVFALPGNTTSRGMATVDARMTAEAGRNWSLSLDYQGQFARHLHDNALSVGFTKHF